MFKTTIEQDVENILRFLGNDCSDILGCKSQRSIWNDVHMQSHAKIHHVAVFIGKFVRSDFQILFFKDFLSLFSVDPVCWSTRSSGSNKSCGIMILFNKKRFIEGSCSKMYTPNVKLWRRG